MALSPLWRNTDLILPAEDNTILLLNTADYDPVYSKCARALQILSNAKLHFCWKHLLLQRRYANDCILQAQYRGFMDSLTWGGHRHTVKNIGFPTYKQSKYLDGLLSPLFGRSSHHLMNSIEFVHTSGPLRVGIWIWSEAGMTCPPPCIYNI